MYIQDLSGDAVIETPATLAKRPFGVGFGQKKFFLV